MLRARQTVRAAAAAAFLFTAACQGSESQDGETANAANAAQPPAVPSLPIPVPEPPMDREQLLIAALHAATAFDAGVKDADLQKKLADRKFEFRILFGCDGPAKNGGKQPFGWAYDPQTRALKVRASPTLSLEDAPVKAVAGEAFETVEGFWIARPWLLQPVCPAADRAVPVTQADASSKPPAAALQLLGIAQFFTATGPRTMRRSGRPYEATKKLDSDQPPTGGFDLVLTGRLVALPDGRVIACTRAAGGERPTCLASVEFGTVSIERADTREQLAQWGSG